MKNYEVRVGTSVRDSAAEGCDELLSQPTDYREDDGALILHVGMDAPLCTDCGVGRLCWAEAGYAPWHRVCDRCGSHWELHSIVWGPTRPKHQEPVLVPTGKCQDEPLPIYDEIPPPEYVRWVQGSGLVAIERDEPLGKSGRTWGDLLGLLTDEHWELADTPERREQMCGLVVVPAAWARRARFYSS